MINKGF